MPRTLADRLFLAFLECHPSVLQSSDGKPDLTYERFMCACAVLLKGSAPEKARFLFAVYDTGGTHAELSRAELRRFMALICFDRPQSAAEYDGAISDVWIAAKARKSDVLSQIEWCNWCESLYGVGAARRDQASIGIISETAKDSDIRPSAASRHPLTGWLEVVGPAALSADILQRSDTVVARWNAVSSPGLTSATLHGLLCGNFVAPAGASAASDASTSTSPSAPAMAPTSTAGQGATLFFDPRDCEAVFKRLRAASSTSIMDAAALSNAFGPLVPRYICDKLVTAACRLSSGSSLGGSPSVADSSARGALIGTSMLTALSLHSFTWLASAVLQFEDARMDSAAGGEFEFATETVPPIVFLLFAMYDSNGDGLFDIGGTGNSTVGRDLRELIEHASLCIKLSQGVLPSPLSAAGRRDSACDARTVLFDASLGVIDSHGLASVRSKSLAGLKELQVSSAVEIAAVHGSVASGSSFPIHAVPLLPFASWCKRHPELFSMFHLVAAALRVECGIRPLRYAAAAPLFTTPRITPTRATVLAATAGPIIVPVAAAAVGKIGQVPSLELSWILSTLRGFSHRDPGHVGDAWFVVPSEWFRLWTAFALQPLHAVSRHRELAPSPLPGPIPTSSLCISVAMGTPFVQADTGGTGDGVSVPSATIPILRPDAIEDVDAIPDLLRASSTEKALSGRAPPVISRTLKNSVTSVPSSSPRFVLLPRRTWTALRYWYGTDGPELPRSVSAVVGLAMQSGGSGVGSGASLGASERVLELELFPPWVRISQLLRPPVPAAGKSLTVIPSKSNSTTVTRWLGFGGAKSASDASAATVSTPFPTTPPRLLPITQGAAPCFPAPTGPIAPVSCNVFIFSRASTLESTLDAISLSLGCRTDKSRLWLCSRELVKLADAPQAPWRRQIVPASSASPAVPAPSPGLWPFIPLFSYPPQTPLSAIPGLGDAGDEDGADIVIDVQAPVDGQWASVVSGHAAVYFFHYKTALDNSPSAAADSGPLRKPGSLDITNSACLTGAADSRMYPGALVLSQPSVSGAGEATVQRFRLRPNALVGLSNLGNTCYLNSALQCLLHTPLLSPYFLSDEWCFDVNTTAALGTKGTLAAAFADLVREVWESQGKDKLANVRGGDITAPSQLASVAPRRLKHWLAEAEPRFAGNEQHDSQEALSTLLSFLIEDLNRVGKKPYVTQPDSDGRPDTVVAEEWWVNHLAREQSIFTSLFTGQFKSVLTCLHCGFTSARFEPFTTLSLSLPQPRERYVTVTLVFPHPSIRPLVATLALPPPGTVRDLKLAAAVLCNAHLARLTSKFSMSAPVHTPTAAGSAAAVEAHSFKLRMPTSVASRLDTSKQRNSDAAVTSPSSMAADSPDASDDCSAAAASVHSIAGLFAAPPLHSMLPAGNSQPQSLNRLPALLRPGPGCSPFFSGALQPWQWLESSLESPIKTSSLPGDVDVALRVSAERCALVRCSGHMLHENLEGPIPVGNSALLYEIDDNTPLAAFRDGDYSALVLYVGLPARDAERASFNRGTDLICSAQGSSGVAGGTDPVQYIVPGTPVKAMWQHRRDKLFNATVLSVRFSAAPEAAAASSSVAATAAATAAAAAGYDSDSDEAQALRDAAAAAAAAVTAARTKLCDVYYDDGDMAVDVPASELVLRLPYLITLQFIQRTLMLTDGTVPFGVTQRVVDSPPSYLYAAPGASPALVSQALLAHLDALGPPSALGPLPAADTPGYAAAGSGCTTQQVSPRLEAVVRAMCAAGSASTSSLLSSSTPTGASTAGEVTHHAAFAAPAEPSTVPSPVGACSASGYGGFCPVIAAAAAPHAASSPAASASLAAFVSGAAPVSDPAPAAGGATASSRAYFLSSLSPVVFGAPRLTRVCADTITPAELYAQAALWAAAFIRRPLPLRDPLPLADGAATSGAAVDVAAVWSVWGFTLRFVGARTGLACSRCRWLKNCPGCIIPPVSGVPFSRYTPREGEAVAVDWDPALLEECADRVAAVARDVDASVAAAAAADSRSTSLGQCLDAFSREETLDEPGFCPRCSKVRVRVSAPPSAPPVSAVAATAAGGAAAGEGASASPAAPAFEDRVVFRRQSKRLEVWRCPPVLLIQLKRFQQAGTLRRKLHNHVTFPLDGLSLAPYVARGQSPHPPPDLTSWLRLGGRLSTSVDPGAAAGAAGVAAAVAASAVPSLPTAARAAGPSAVQSLTPPLRPRTSSSGPTEAQFAGLPCLLSRTRAEYDLFGCVSHYGAMGAGHYIAYARSPFDDRWHCYNDRTVSDVGADAAAEIASPAAYLLFYGRHDISEGWRAALRAEDATLWRVVAAAAGSASAAATKSAPAPRPLETWEVFPHRAGSALSPDLARLRASMLAAGATVETLGMLDSLADKCAVM